jgi:hypothetical protein
MTYLLARYPHLRRLPKAFGQSLRQALGLFTIILMAACGTKDATQSGNDNRLELQDLPGQVVSQTGTKPTPAEVEARELQYHSNRWSEVKPEMRAYIDIHRSGSTPRSVSPGTGDSAASAVKSVTDAEAEKIESEKPKVVTKPGLAPSSVNLDKAGIDERAKRQPQTAVSQTKQEKNSAVAEKLKRELADIEVPVSLPETGKTKQRLADTGKKKGEAAPSEDDGSEIDLSEPIVANVRPQPSASKTATREADQPLQKAIEETNRRAMLSNPGLSNPGLNNPGIGTAESNQSEQAGESAEGPAKLANNAAGRNFGFASSFIVLAAALIVILAVKRTRRVKPPIDPNKTN